ncbi:MAG: Flp pilus assembly complex ATPase component TadA [Proteobacteria bacterium]|nr:Flp pilus assembly complex ATPase component TadA [Pseudomonadota bacterium]MBU1387977.1 Flp pilus assembly complex ATPase component TadA [Pseudomonadota bacterium]MBU1542040.1 Flp pilus assembly complex ATPase component TadA [Pseudomonadota bacterium]
MARNERFGEYLVSQAALSQEQLSQVLARQKVLKDKLGHIAVKEGYLEPEQLLSDLSSFLGIPMLSETVTDIRQDVVHLIPRKMCLKTGVLPVALGKNNELLLACSGPVPKAIIQNMSRLAQRQVKLVLTSPERIKNLQNQYYSRGFDTTIKPETAADPGNTTFIIELFEKIMIRAINAGASDIHIEPERDELIIRFRIDGVMNKTESLPYEAAGKLISRIKVLGGLDIAERRKPQDGSFHFMPRLLDLSIDGVNVRISILPVINGEKAVLRLLPPHDVLIGMETLGMPSAMLSSFNSHLASPYGIILVTGPTGSGKSTTLYGAIQHLRSEHNNITTIEDPVELTVRGVNQTQVDTGEKISFAAALRAILRQDPDIIMVGEIRDTETLRISLRAAVTGHLVLSTLHTNDAPSAFNRMTDMGAEPFLVAASVRAVLAQRLVRKNCPFCGVSQDITRPELALLGLPGEEPFTVKRGRGCEHCTLGYKGRMGVFELLSVDEQIRRMIIENATFEDIRAYALAKTAYRTMRSNGIDKIRQGLTTPEEILRITLD